MKYILVLFGIATLLLAACTTPVTTGNESINVAVTFYPYYDLTRQIVGETGAVYSVVPPATEPHSFNPSARDLADLQDITVYVKTGVEFESFEDRLLSAVPATASIIDTSRGIELIAGGQDHNHDGEEHKEESHVDEEPHKAELYDDKEHESAHHDDGHMNETDYNESVDQTHSENEHNESDHQGESDHPENRSDSHAAEHDDHATGTDPHVWLSPKNAQTITNNIVEGLAQKHPEQETKLRANAAILLSELQDLDQAYATRLSSCEKDVVMVTHNAYQYLAQEYEFEVISISGLSPESEPTPGQLANLVDEARLHDLHYLFFEEFVDPRVAEVIAKEAGTQTLTINPVAGSNVDTGYVAIMYDNLDKLSRALECQ